MSSRHLSRACCHPCRSPRAACPCPARIEQWAFVLEQGQSLYRKRRSIRSFSRKPWLAGCDSTLKDLLGLGQRTSVSKLVARLCEHSKIAQDRPQQQLRAAICCSIGRVSKSHIAASPGSGLFELSGCSELLPYVKPVNGVLVGICSLTKRIEVWY